MSKCIRIERNRAAKKSIDICDFENRSKTLDRKTNRRRKKTRETVNEKLSIHVVEYVVLVSI